MAKGRHHRNKAHVRLLQLQALPLPAKIRAAQNRVRQWYNHWDGEVAVSFSGGKDSTVLLHLVRDLYPDVSAFFVDTGLEYPEVREFVKATPNVEWVKPKMSFRKVIETYGYPVISKEVAGYLREVESARRSGNTDWVKQRLEGIKPDGSKSRYCIPKKWRFMADAPFRCSERCCDVMKKRPVKSYIKRTGNHPILGTMAADSMLRLNSWIRNGCNTYETASPQSRPLSFWTDDDIWAYLREHGIPYASVYDQGVEHTGCVFCAFGAHLDDSPNRFERLKETHPRLWSYTINKLGFGEVLDYTGIPYGGEPNE